MTPTRMRVANEETRGSVSLAGHRALFFHVFVVATFVVATLSYRLIEAPSRRAINGFERAGQNLPSNMRRGINS
jgi:peptidoglycan/LPS O-acetylase OafA/YrhL